MWVAIEHTLEGFLNTSWTQHFALKYELSSYFGVQATLCSVLHRSLDAA